MEKVEVPTQARGRCSPDRFATKRVRPWRGIPERAHYIEHAAITQDVMMAVIKHLFPSTALPTAKMDGIGDQVLEQDVLLQLREQERVTIQPKLVAQRGGLGFEL